LSLRCPLLRPNCPTPRSKVFIGGRATGRYQRSSPIMVAMSVNRCCHCVLLVLCLLVATACERLPDIEPGCDQFCTRAFTCQFKDGYGIKGTPPSRKASPLTSVQAQRMDQAISECLSGCIAGTNPLINPEVRKKYFSCLKKKQCGPFLRCLNAAGP
jgi:hypothetical protein